MGWPTDQTDGPHMGELLINGTWVDVSSYIRGEHQIRIERGRRDVQGRALMPPTTCDFTLNNRDGRFTDDNPLSPYFELLPLYTQFRFSMPGGSDNYMYLPGHDTINYARTGDKAALDITGDIDIRIDFAPASWNMSSPENYFSVLASKSGDPNSDLSWLLGLRQDGRPYFNWSTTGNGFAGLGFTGPKFDSSIERQALRVTLDVNNGTGSFDLKWYTSDTIDGTWTLVETDLGATFGLGTTSIWSGAGLLEVGAGWLGGSVYNTAYTFSGKIYAFRLYNGIGGSLVAEADFRTKPYGNANFSDGLGNTWEVRNGAIITSDELRFWGEIEEFPQEWDATGNDMFCRVHAADLLARLGTTQTPAPSPIYQNRIQYDPTGYWTFEDGSDATRAGAASRDTAAVVTSAITFKAADDLPGSNGVAQFQSASAFARGRTRSTSTTGTASGLIFFKFGTLPASTVPIISFTTAGSSAYSWRIETDGGSFTMRAFDADGASLLSSAILLGGVSLNKWIGIRLELTTSGANIAWALAWHQVGSNTFLGGSGTIAGAPGRITGFQVNGAAANTDMYFSHIWIDTSLVDFVTDEFRNSSNGYIGETFGARFRRICDQIGVTADIDGWEFDTSPVGRQRSDTPLNILQEGADVDGGFLTGSRRAGNTLTYVTRARIQAQSKIVTLDHEGGSHLAAAPKPTKGAVGVANDVTVRRPDGGYSRVVIEDGRYGTDAIGTVPVDETYNTATDEATESIAGWLASLGSSGEYRFPEIVVALNRPETLFGSTIAQSILALDLGRYIEITDLPAGQAPGPYEQIVQGYAEIISNKLWSITYNGTPYGPWRAGIIESSGEPIRFAATATTVNATVNSSATSVVFKTPDSSARWVVNTDTGIPANTFPMQVMIGGELMTVSTITGTAAAGGFYTQTATVTRSVNGVQKSQTAGTTVQVKRITRFGR